MKFCKNCGTQLDDFATFCPTCGQAVDSQPQNQFNQPAKPGFDLSTLAMPDLAIIIGAALMLIGSFLPYASAFGNSINLWDDNRGLIIVIGAIVAAVLTVLKIQKAGEGVGIIVGAYTAFICLLDFMDTTGDYSYVSLGIGYYLILIAAIALIVGAVLKFKNKTF